MTQALYAHMNNKRKKKNVGKFSLMPFMICHSNVVLQYIQTQWAFLDFYVTKSSVTRCYAVIMSDLIMLSIEKLEF
jgi:hypothetical protein